MKSNIFRKLIIMTILVNFLPPLNAEDRRTIPLDMYLIIDGSSALESSKNDVISWINQELVDGILTDGDRITVWKAGDKAEVIYSDTLSASFGKSGLKDTLKALNTGGETADFSGALNDALPKISQTPDTRLAYTMLITSSARGMVPALSGSSQNLLRWFRSEKYKYWQVLVVAPNIGEKVRQNARAYMSSIN